MSEPKPDNESTADSVRPAEAAAGDPPAPGGNASGQLTKEEQWALFEKELKESDWGHQPC